MSHRTNLATPIQNALRQVLEQDANTLSSETGFVQRQRKLTGSTFAHLMRCGAPSHPCPTSTDWTQAAALVGTTLTPQGIEQRFTPEAAPFLYALLQRLVACVVPPCTPAVAPLLQCFAGVFIEGSPVITLPRALASVWQGLGEGASAAVKMQVRWNFSTGQLDGPTLQPACCHDRLSPYGVEDLPGGELGVGGLGVLWLGGVAGEAGVGALFCASLQDAYGSANLGG
jgi:hypothetical protein